MGTFLIVCVTLISLMVMYCFFILTRNSVVYLIRRWFLDNKRKDYYSLPNYQEMVFNSKHYLRWTVKSWQKWVERKNQEVE